MSNIHRLRDVVGIEQEAGTWIARLHADDVTPDDLARFETWRAAHPRHARAFDEISRTLAEVKRAGRLVRAVAFSNAMNAASDPRRRPGRFRLAAAAAVAAVLLVAGAWWGLRIGSETQFQTAIGEHASVELPDGSRLELNSNSLARVEYTRQARTIRLTRGEAYFKVAHEPQRPFWVVAGDSWIRAVGTAFNVDVRSSGVRVIVSEGTIKVATARPNYEPPSDASLAQAPVSVLTAGQQVELKEGAARIRPAQPMELTRLAAWRKGKLYFENQRLESVVEELGRYTPVQISIEDEALRNLSIGGTFQANSQGVDALLEMLERGFGLQVRREGDDRIYIGDAPPK
ncbi:MAG: FecR domain-containing protein [Gammaproteobacteria bacterium]